MTGDLETRRRSAPWLSDKRPVLEYWAGCYDRVFIALHPFQDAQRARTRTLAEIGRRCAAPDFATMVWTTMLMTCAGVSSRTADLAPFRFAHLIDQDLMARIEAFQDDEGLSPPDCDALPSALAPAFADAFDAVGADGLSAAHHQVEACRRLTVADLRARDRRTGAPSPNWRMEGRRPNVLHDDACRMLIACQPMDCVETMIAIRNDVVESAALDRRFEGLWAGPHTTVGWMNDIARLDPPAGFGQA